MIARWLVLGVLLVATATAAKPVSPLCFTESVYGAHWVLDTAQVGGHWLVAGHADLNGFRYPVNGSGIGPTAEVYTGFGGNEVWAYVNLNSEAYPIPAPNTANIYFYVYYSVWEEEGGYYATRKLYPPLFAYLVKVPC